MNFSRKNKVKNILEINIVFFAQNGFITLNKFKIAYHIVSITENKYFMSYFIYYK